MLTPQEMADAKTVDRALDGLRQIDLHAWEHEIAHKLVAGVLAAGYQQRTGGEGTITGTPFQVGVIGAAGPQWDRMNDRYLRTSDHDDECLRAAERVGYKGEFLLYVARTILGTIAPEVRGIARETLPPGPIQEIRSE